MRLYIKRKSNHYIPSSMDATHSGYMVALFHCISKYCILQWEFERYRSISKNGGLFLSDKIKTNIL